MLYDGAVTLVSGDYGSEATVELLAELEELKKITITIDEVTYSGVSYDGFACTGDDDIMVYIGSDGHFSVNPMDPGEYDLKITQEEETFDQIYSEDVSVTDKTHGEYEMMLDFEYQDCKVYHLVIDDTDLGYTGYAESVMSFNESQAVLGKYDDAWTLSFTSRDPSQNLGETAHVTIEVSHDMWLD